MENVHPTAVIHPKTRIRHGVSVGPYAVIEEDVEIGEGSEIMTRVYIGAGTKIGRNNTIHTGAAIGGSAQHRTAEQGGRLVIGDRNVLREYVTVHRSYLKDSATVIGDDNYLMAFSHIGHDCRVENHVTVANATLIGGHVLLEQNCIISALIAVHQFCRIGRYALLGARASITKDLPPYMLVDNNDETVGSINLVGLKKANFSESAKHDIKKAYRLLYLSDLSQAEALVAIEKACPSPETAYLVDFIRKSKRGILPHRRTGVAVPAPEEII